MQVLTNPELFFFDQIEAGIDGALREVGEELEEPRDKLGSQLLGLHARLRHIDNPLVVLHILK